MSAYRRAGTKETVLICVAAVILLTAGYVWMSSHRSSVLKGVASPQSFKCEACGAVFDLTPDEVDRQLSAPGIAGGRSDPTASRDDESAARFVCKKCRKRAAVPLGPLAGPAVDDK